MPCVCVIPARGGSTRIPRKNIKSFHGKPIIAYSIETAQKAGIFDRIIVSTDDDEIGDIARSYDADVIMRRSDMAQNEVGTQAVMKYVLGQIEGAFDYACCLYATAPMLSPDTLQKAFTMLQKNSCPYVVPVATWLRDPGQFYFGRADAFEFSAALNTTGTNILWIDPKTECDINTPEDFFRAEKMYEELNKLNASAELRKI